MKRPSIMTIMFLIILLITVLVLNSCQDKPISDPDKRTPYVKAVYKSEEKVPQMRKVCESPEGYVYTYFENGLTIYVYEGVNGKGSISVH